MAKKTKQIKKPTPSVDASWATHRRVLLSDPAVQEAYEKLRPEYEMAESLIRLRSRRRLSQKALAARAGTGQPSVARLESGRYSGASLKTLHKIATALGGRLVVRFE